MLVNEALGLDFPLNFTLDQLANSFIVLEIGD